MNYWLNMMQNIQKEKALKQLKEQLCRLDELKKLPHNNNKFRPWQIETEHIVRFIFGEESPNYENIRNMNYPSHPAAVAIGFGKDFQANYLRKLDNYSHEIQGQIKEIELLEDRIVTDKQQLLVDILKHFHRFVLQLRYRHDNRTTIEVKDEYDVQDILHAILGLHFSDVREEEYTPSYAGGSSRMDFLLKGEGIVIEVKKTNPKLKDKELCEQLSIDIAKYSAHPDCKTLVCFIYDPKEHIKNPEALERDLSKSTQDYKVLIVISPRR